MEADLNRPETPFKMTGKIERVYTFFSYGRESEKKKVAILIAHRL